MDERIELKKEVAVIGKRIDDERAEWKKALLADKPFYERTIDALTAEKAALITRIATFDELVLIKARADALASAPAPGKNTPLALHASVPPLHANTPNPPLVVASLRSNSRLCVRARRVRPSCEEG
jgi:hypothetical protein